MITAIAQSAERREGAVSILAMLEENADGGPGVKASELAAVRSVIEASVRQLDGAWERA